MIQPSRKIPNCCFQLFTGFHACSALTAVTEFNIPAGRPTSALARQKKANSKKKRAKSKAAKKRAASAPAAAEEKGEPKPSSRKQKSGGKRKSRSANKSGATRKRKEAEDESAPVHQAQRPRRAAADHATAFTMQLAEMSGLAMPLPTAKRARSVAGEQKADRVPDTHSCQDGVN